MDEKVLHSSSPVLFNKNNERINYRVQENLIIIDELIEKVTLRIGNEKVTIQKKKSYFN
jgi:type IV secretion system protein VirB9